MACFSSSKKVHADNSDSVVQKVKLVPSFRIVLEMEEEEED